MYISCGNYCHLLRGHTGSGKGKRWQGGGGGGDGGTSVGVIEEAKKDRNEKEDQEGEGEGGRGRQDEGGRVESEEGHVDGVRRCRRTAVKTEKHLVPLKATGSE